MPTELPKQYDPKQAQERFLRFWDEHGYFHTRPDSRESFCIVIPPPNVTGALHIGHALNNTLQDVLIRFRRAQGYNTLWMPGTDHAGIATQAVVERRIKEEEGKTKHDLGREELNKRIWQWKDQYETRILRQLRELGASCDWQRTRFTLDEVCARAVRQTFFNMFRDGLIFRGKRLVNWDTQLQTSVADDETFTETVKGGFWTFKYPVRSAPVSDPADSATEGLQSSGRPAVGVSAGSETRAEQEFIRFSTTRPETMLGDTAVAVHPKDPRYKALIGQMVTIPLVNRDIPIIADGELVDPTFGTGAVKVTPAHDPNDYRCGMRHNLPMINILNPDGTINENGGAYKGLDRFEARKRVVEDMEKLGLFEGKEDKDIELKHSDRSKSPIEPYLSDQWFVKMGDHGDGKPGLARMAMDAVENGHVRFFPERYKNSYLDWLAEKRDWCISRQLWWGHRIPIWTLGLHGPGQGSIIESLDEYFQEIGRRDEIILKPIGDEEQGEIQICTRTPEADRAVEAMNCFYQIGKYDPNLSKQYQDVVTSARAWEIAQKIMGGPAADPITQDPDVLDTWFSSALWPHSTLGWPELTPELRYYYPTSVLVTNRDIITLWVARMVITGLFNIKQEPFRHVYIHPKILDGFGEGMSKSKGNGVDPLDIIERYGTDALRFVLVHLATETQDSRMPVANVCPHCDTLVPVKQEHMYMRTKKLTCPSCKKPFRPGGPWPSEDPELKTAKQASDKFEMGRNFANKLWNAARFIMMNLEGYTPQAIRTPELPIEDRWILSRLATTTADVTDHLENYRFSDAIRTIYDFTWSEFCDWYVEMSKGRLKKDEGGRMKDEQGAGHPSSFILHPSGQTAQRVLTGVLDAILRLVQPVMPFVAESIWQALADSAFERGLPNPEPASESVVIAPWPEFPASWKDAAMEHRVALMQELVRAVREVRNRYQLEKAAFDVFVKCNESVTRDFEALAPFIKLLGNVSQLTCGPSVAKPPQSAGYVHPEFEAYVSLQGLIDPAAEKDRLVKQLAEKKKHLQGAQAKLGNASFVERAPAEVVEQQRALVADYEKQIQALQANLSELGG